MLKGGRVGGIDNNITCGYRVGGGKGAAEAPRAAVGHEGVVTAGESRIGREDQVATACRSARTTLDEQTRGGASQEDIEVATRVEGEACHRQGSCGGRGSRGK